MNMTAASTVPHYIWAFVEDQINCMCPILTFEATNMIRVVLNLIYIYFFLQDYCRSSATAKHKFTTLDNPAILPQLRQDV